MEIYIPDNWIKVSKDKFYEVLNLEGIDYTRIGYCGGIEYHFNHGLQQEFAVIDEDKDEYFLNQVKGI